MLPSTREMIRALIAAPSVSSVNPEFDMPNGGVVDLVAEWLSELGAAVRIDEFDAARGKRNLIATIGNGPPGLALSGHTDTVPFDEARWQSDPFSATERDGRVYGLGSADMKSFFAVIVDALRTLKPDRLQRSLVIVASADEESSMAGARRLEDSGEALAPFAVIGEPTGLKPVRMHKGALMEGIRLIGRSGHSSNPGLGVNAIDGMATVIEVLSAWRDELRDSHRDDAFDVPYPTLNFGHIRGGDNPNRICAQCEMHIDFRLVPGMTVHDSRKELRRRVQASLDGSNLTVEFDALFEGADPLNTAPGSPLVRRCSEHCDAHAGAVNFCTEGPFFSNLGAETVILGPGSIDVAHQPDEYLELDSLPQATALVAKLIHDFCGDPTWMEHT